jgi:hypothetical protein
VNRVGLKAAQFHPQGPLNDELFQVGGLFSKPATANECSPLDRSRWISKKSIRQSDGLGFDSCASVYESRDNRLRQKVSIERVRSG